jgi:hypothetical protein
MCNFCKGSGWIVASNKKQGSIYGFRCSCYKGNYLSKSIPEWNTRKHSLEYTADFEQTVAIIPDNKIKASDPEATKPVYASEFDDSDLPW